MRYWTWAELKAAVQAETATEGEEFVDETELLRYANKAIDDCEAWVHGIYEDYFLTRANLVLVSGAEDVDMPTDIYANKIRHIIYKSGSNVYEIKRIKEWKKFLEYTLNLNISASPGQYKYFITNEVAGAPTIILSPTPLESGTLGKIWYLRNANRLTVDADILDIPEAANYVLQSMKVAIFEKEGHPMYAAAKWQLDDDTNPQSEKAKLVAALTDMVPDGENELEADLSIYEEHT